MAASLAREIGAWPAPDAASPVTAKAITCLFDFFSCAFEARDLAWSRQALASVMPVPGGAVIVGGSERATPQDAAFVNAVMGHGLVREDMHAGAIAHLGVVVWPALIARLGMAKAPVAGRDLIAAAAIGYEVGARIGRIVMTAELARLYRPTGLVGPLAGAAAGARLIGLPAEETASALALAANTSSGLNQWPHSGTSDMYFHPGFAARNALAALALAEAGAIGSPDILEGEAGFFAAFGRAPARARPELFSGGEAEILAVFNKPVPACNYAQTPCQAALALGPGIEGGSTAIRAIEIGVSEAAVRYPGCDAAGPYQRPLQAKMSIQFGVAATFATGSVAEANYARLDDPEIARLVSITRLVEEAPFTRAYPARQGARVAVTLADGTRHERVLDDVVFATPDEVLARFREAAALRLGGERAARLEAAIAGLHAASDARAIAELAGLPQRAATSPAA
jgi:2-methylcitrate dehydratase PrpD